MSMSDDPRGFRRGQPGNRDQAAPQQGRGAPPRDDRYDSFRQPEPQAGRQPEKHQPSFSAYRPEAYASDRPTGRQERSDWDAARSTPPAPPPSRNLAPTSEPFPRAQQDRDPYRSQNSADPYAAPNGNQRGYDNDWRADPYSDQNTSYFPPDEPTGGDAQSVHDRFFASEAERAPPPPPPAPRFKAPRDDLEFAAEQANGFGNYPAQRHSGVHGASVGFNDRREEDWEQPPAPTSVRPFHAPATIPDDELDADFFSDEDDYDADEYPPEKKGGRAKLMAAVLVGAVVTGGGLAYVYKTSGGAGGDGYPPVISADARPIKNDPSEPGGRDFPNGNKLIYDRLGGVTQEAGAAPTRLAGAGAPASGKKETQGVLTTGGTLEERIENALKAQKEEEPAQTRGAAGSGSPDAPRSVRTVTYGVDGTEQAAPSKTQRVSSSSVVVTTTQPTSASAREDPPAAEQPAESNAAAAPAESAPAARRPVKTAAVEAGATGGFFTQVGARNDQEAAMAAFATLQQKYASVLGNHSPSVVKVDLGEKGVWYRLRVGPFDSKGEAEQLCEQLKTAGMKGCFARKD